VSVLSFEGGAQIVYKPRNIDVEQRWNEILAWLAARGAPVDLRGLRTLPRAEHGWVELARSGPCASAADFPRFYRRAGALLCLVHLLAGNDCHRENLIAVGEYPVLIDVETLMHPAAPPEASDDDARARLTRELEHSVLGTAMLPHWSPMPSGGGYESGGIGPGGRLQTTIEARVPQGRNTDEVTHTTQRIELGATSNVPFADEVFAVAEEHIDALVDGFESTARFVLEHRAALLDPDGPVQAFAGVRVRVLMRGTPVYARTGERALAPDALRSGAPRSIALDSLARPLTSQSFPPDAEAAAWRMVEHERAALERLDIPRFEVRADQSAAEWRPHWSCSGLELARGRIAGLDEQHIARQLGLIRASFEARSAARDLPTPMRSRAHASDHAATDDELRSAAEHITARVKALATRGADDTAIWLTADVMEDSGAYRLRPMSSNLYSGTAGVGLFLAAASVLLDDRDARELALAAVRSTRLALARGPLLHASLPIGGVMGIASTAYALAWMGRLLDDASLLDDAVTILDAIDERSIEADRYHDLAGGSAGAILVLLAVQELRPDRDFIALAHRCGERLLATRIGEPASWATPTGVRLSGLAHGASGVAWALHRLSEHSHDPRFAAAADEALDFERTLFHPNRRNWQDVRPDVPPGEPFFMNSWCNGAAGIGMVRLRQPAHAHRRDEELAAALHTTCRHGFGQLDHFCCGNVGRAELLLDAGRRLGDDQLIVQSRRVLASMCRRAEQRGAWALAGRPHPGAEHAGLFRGLSGLGWHFLRQLAPDRLPAMGVLEGLPS
jgi:type 2 lantibiotic biosynthesis protein LanM